jgi:mannose-1-phosphate guanylyltransferase
VKEQLPDLPEANIIIEPFGKNTAAAIAYSNLIMDSRYPDAVSVVLSADHHIDGLDAFHEAIMEGVAAAGNADRALVSLGIVPTRPHTGFGYMQCGDRISGTRYGYEGKRYIEKPPKLKARIYLKSGCYLWNSGIFVWGIRTLNAAIKHYQPGIYARISEIHSLFQSEQRDETHLNQIYSGIESMSIDNSVLENVYHDRKFTNIFIRGEFQWSDIGSYADLGRFIGRDANRNTIIGDVSIENIDRTKNAFIYAETPMAIHLDHVASAVVAVNAHQDVLIMPNSKTQYIGTYLDALSRDKESPKLLNKSSYDILLTDRRLIVRSRGRNSS